MDEVFKKISEHWFLSEPAFFALYCLQQFEANDAMTCPMRCGKGKIEYNPELLSRKSTKEVELLLKIEMIRLFLKHPYERQPEGASRAALSLGSDVTIKTSYNGPKSVGTMSENLPLLSPNFFKLDDGMPFEWYVRKISDLLPEGDDSDEGGTPSADELKAAQDKAGLWEEDGMKAAEINDLIEKMNSWGSIPGDMVQQIIASTKARIDYHQIMQGFRGTILSSQTRLTRMRPNRRTGFDQMGSIRKFDTKLLVAVDVSGSISDRSLSDFYSVINKMFRYGIHEIDCVQFDCDLGEVKPIRKASRTVQVVGRGGTSFQPIFDYLKEHNVYDGVIILTDGYAAHPKMDDTIIAKVLWVCEDERCYNEHKDWMQLYGRVCWMYL